MTDPTCVCCERPTPDGYACTACTRRAADQLATIVDMTPAARDVAHGQARHGTAAGGSSEPRLVLNLAATQRLDQVQAKLTTWMRHVSGTRGRLTGADRGTDPIIAAARWLPDQLEWLRHRQEVDEALADIAACARIVTGIARGPGERKYLGPCVEPTGPPPDRCPVDCGCHRGPHYPCTEPGGCGSVGCGRPTGVCGGNVYVRVLNTETGVCADTGACHRCRAEVPTKDRRAWLDGEVRQRAYRAVEIAQAYDVNVNTIRSWAARGHLRSYWRTETGLTVEWADPPIDPQLTGPELARRETEVAEELTQRGPRVHYVGDVLDLAAADAARRAGEQAKRARRAAAREAAATPA